MVRQGDLPNPRDGASAPRLPGTDARPFCCVYSYTDENEIVGAECVELDDTFDETECTKLVNNPLDPTAPQRQRGVVAECCRDCELLARKLIITRCGNRTFLAGAGRILPYSSPAESPEDCCCGDVPRCVQVPGCNQVDCYPEPPSSGDKCDGRCLSMQYDDEGNELVDERGLVCATKVQCCADDNSQCEERCYDSTIVAPIPGHDPITPEPDWFGPENQWTPMACTTGCGVCCTHVYDTTTGSPTYGQSMFRLGVTSLTEEECAADFYDPNTLGPVNNPVRLGPVGDWIANTDDTNVCNPDCCLDRTRGQAEEASCHYTDQLYCDPCKGRCVDVTAENDPGMCPREFCATKQECCGDGNELCTAGLCGPGAPARYRWEAMDCGTDPDSCGSCCKHLYNDDETEIIGLECDQSANTREKCEELIESVSGFVQYGTWTPFETCRVCADLVPCCREIACPDGNRAVCVEVLPEDCNFCLGRCTELATDEQSCKTKQDCCDNDNFKCGICGVDPTHSWEFGCADATKCGVCCKLTINQNTGDVIAATCDDTMTSEQCAALQDANPNLRGEWKPFETCATVKCLTKPCCGEGCGGAIECIQIPYADECNPCHGRCQPADGADYCGTKQECCGDDGSLCRPECPDSNTWTPVCPDNGVKCGVCCETEIDLNTGKIISSTCNEISYAQCLENAQNNNPALTFAWKAFETCDSVICNPKICCKEICPDVVGCTVVDINDTCNECGGLCYPGILDDATGIISIDPDGAPECSDKLNCCGGENEKCQKINDCPQDQYSVYVACNDCQSGCRCTSPNYATNNVAMMEFGPKYFASCGSRITLVPDRDVSLMTFLINSIEDPCFEGCGPKPPESDGQAYEEYQRCKSEAQSRKIWPFTWKQCYPELLGGRPLYFYSEQCYYDFIDIAARDRGDGVVRKVANTSAGAFYVCDGEKLVDVTETILTKNKVKICERTITGITNSPGSISETTNTAEVDPFKYGTCDKYTLSPNNAGGDPYFTVEYRAQSCIGNLIQCEPYSNPQTEVPDPDMINCPAPFTMNPLP